MLWLAWFVLKETLYPDKVLTGGGQLPLGGMEITSKSFKERRIQTHFEKKGLIPIWCVQEFWKYFVQEKRL